jgi:hypothetical protein
MTTFVKGYFREAKHRPAYIAKTTELLPYDLGDELVGALMAANLAEPLDDTDMDEAKKQRMRETY